MIRTTLPSHDHTGAVERARALRTLKRRYTMHLACAAAAVLLSMQVHAETPPMPNVLPMPSTGKEPLSSANRPGNEYSDLPKAGYVEEEYYLYGAAAAVTAAGENLFQAPYISRMLVRRPKDPAKFNGTVIIEPFSWLGERGTSWILTRDYLLRKGYAYVGYTLSMNKPEQDPKTTTDPTWRPNPQPPSLNLDFMRKFDYARYAPLGFYYDEARFRRGGHADPFLPQSQAISAQVALLFKSNAATSPMHGFKVERVYVDSFAVQAQMWMDYLDQGRHQQWRLPDGRPLIDAYMTGKMNYGEVGGEDIRVPRHMPDDAPFVTIFEQNGAMYDAEAGIPMPPDTDQPKQRYYELTGVAHLRLADLGTGEEGAGDFQADAGKENDKECRTLYDEPTEVVVSALLDGMDRWVRDGKPMLKETRVQRKSQGRGLVRDPQTQNLIGGIRPPWIAVPAAAYMTATETQCSDRFFDTKIPYDAKQLRALYGNYATYVSKFAAAKQAAIKAETLLEDDADRVQPVATAKDFIADGRNSK